LQVVMAGSPRFLDVFCHVAVPQAVAEAGAVGHELTQRDGPLGRAQLRLACAVKAFEHLRRREVLQQLADRGIQRELSLLDKLHGRGGRDGLGHRGDPEHAVRCHRGVLGQIALAERALIDHVLAVRGDRNHARDLLRVGLLSEHLVDLGLVVHRSPPANFFRWRRSSSGSLSPASSRGGAAIEGRNLVIGANGRGKHG